MPLDSEKPSRQSVAGPVGEEIESPSARDQRPLESLILSGPRRKDCNKILFKKRGKGVDLMMLALAGRE